MLGDGCWMDLANKLERVALMPRPAHLSDYQSIFELLQTLPFLQFGQSRSVEAIQQRFRGWLCVGAWQLEALMVHVVQPSDSQS